MSRPFVLSCAMAVCMAGSLASAQFPAGSVDFDREVLPILSNNCFVCHGPDEGSRKAGLRLDIREGATKDLGGYAAIVPGDPEKSELVVRITSTDSSEVMPPRRTNKKLTDAQKQILRRWIEQRAPYPKHWSLVPPQRPPIPVVDNQQWPRNPIDRFILARLKQDGLSPSPEADRQTLIRRVTLDLTGLPPTPVEVDAFLDDTSSDAYEKLVDRLLASPRYGERMAMEWLDAARYADTHGYHIDSGRDMTAWREWVIDAFNRNLPFDQFTIDQLAGDMLPQATLGQKIASGFNRNHMINFEGGAIPEEYHAAYIIDRVNTTSTVWLGLTVGCAQCHDHKYDPITQKDYYRFFAFFNNVPENGLDGNKGNANPMLRLLTPQQQQQIDQAAAQINDLQKQLTGPSAELDSKQAQWEKTAISESAVQWVMLEPAEIISIGGATPSRQEDKSILFTGTNPPTDTYTLIAATNLPKVSAIRLEALPDDSLKSRGPGRSENGNAVMTEFRVWIDGRSTPIKSASADFSQDNFPIANAIDGKSETAWAIFPQVGKPHTATFELAPVAASDQPAKIAIQLDFLSQFAQHQFGRIRLSATSAPLDKKVPANIASLIAIPAEKRDEKQKAELRDYYRKHFSPEMQAIAKKLDDARKQQADLEKQVRTTMVMSEMDKPRDTFILLRGQYDKKGEKVTPGVPSVLPQLPADAPASRLTLAKWFVDPSNPLMSRVIVNRYWQMYFGIGLVKTSEDFGAQGERPTHPQLLDWLATQFIASGWDVKAMQRLIITSATYRQASRGSLELLSRDPENRLLAHGPRFRLPAEMIRDQALAVSGLLNGEIGGTSVFPYQPPGLWEELMSRSDGENWSAQKYTPSHGKDLYRRSMYTFWKRTSPPAQLATFDAPDREICTVRRSRTNTPLQALITLNDPTYVEASRKLAERMMTEASASPDQRIAFAFRIILARQPNATEIALLKKVFDQQLAAYKAKPDQAKKLLTVGESTWNQQLDPTELAAWSIVASTLLNLDETLTKG